MTGKFLIDLTDPRFLITPNEDVMEFVRRTSPSAHSDVGIVLLELGKELPGAHAYSPSYKSCAYVVLHTDADRIFGMAFGQNGLAFRLADSDREAAIADGGVVEPRIGADWISFPPYDGPRGSGARERLRRWCARAFADAVA